MNLEGAASASHVPSYCCFFDASLLLFYGVASLHCCFSVDGAAFGPMPSPRKRMRGIPTTHDDLRVMNTAAADDNTHDDHAHEDDSHDDGDDDDNDDDSHDGDNDTHDDDGTHENIHRGIYDDMVMVCMILTMMTTFTMEFFMTMIHMVMI